MSISMSISISAKADISPGGSSFDPDAQAFITAAAITDATQQSAIDTLVTGLKTDGIWTKMKAIYPFVGGTAATHKFNLKDPRDLDAAFRLTFSGGWTHSTTGATPNGTNGFADTKFNPTTQALSTSSQHLSYYSRTNISENAVEIGSLSSSNNNFLGIYVLSTLGTRSSLASSARYNNTGVSIDTRGFFTASRINTTSLKVYANNTIQGSQSIASTANDNFNMYLGTYGIASGQTLWSSKQVALASIGDGLSDTEALNYYNRVQAFQTTLGRSVGPQTVSDADAQAFVTAAAIQDQVQAQAINDLTIGMKADGTWTKMKAIYPFVGGTATSHKYNLKDPRDLNAAFRLTFSGGWTHSSNGATPNGTNGFADTYLTPSANLSLNSTHLSYYSRTNVSANQVEIGITDAGRDLYVLYSFVGNAYKGINAVATILGTLFTPTTGLLIGNRINATTEKYYWKGTLTDTITKNSVSLSSLKIYLGAYNNYVTGPTFYSTKQTAFASIGDGLTDTEAANLYTRVQTLQTTLNRQV